MASSSGLLVSKVGARALLRAHQRRFISFLATIAALTMIALLVIGGHFGPQLGAKRPLSTVLASQTSGNSNLSGTPYWHKPGCHQVGHTRTISIPGCVKFNLSTNACRGFCMSFSIPADEDIGPAPIVSLEQLEGMLAGEVATGGQRAATRAPPFKTSSGSAASLAQQQQQPQQQPQVADERRRMKKSSSDFGVAPSLSWATMEKGDNNNNKQLDKTGRLITPHGLTKAGQRSPLAGAIGDTSVKHDVVSVGQCCNMMETEDVTVNLRCGLNETRRLVFKSAKTCECFFCKHV